jgi:hypothetical protein
MICAKKIFKIFGVKPILSIYSIYGESKMSLERKIIFRLSRVVAGGFWTKFEAQLAQSC